MQFRRSQSVSFKAAPDGGYVGVLVGFSYVGIHDTRDWGPRPKIALRWELHDSGNPHDPCFDEEKLIYVVSQAFPATINGDNSWLYRCLVAHKIMAPGGECPESKEWYGKVAMLTIEGVQGSRGDRVFMNVTNIQPVDDDVNIKPVLSYEHWEAEDTAPPPTWAKYLIVKSRDIYQRGDQAAAPTGTPGPKPGTPAGRPVNPPYQPPVQGGYRAPAPEIDDPDDIPF